MCPWNFKVFPVHWIIIFEMDFVFVVSGQPQVIPVDADGLLVFEQNVDILLTKFIRDLEMVAMGNFFL